MENCLSERERRVLSRAIQLRIAKDGNYRKIYEDLEIRQPIVSLALHRRLVVRTKTVERLFEYLGVDADDMGRKAVDRDSGDTLVSSGGDGPEHGIADAIEAIMLLSDGTSERDAELLDLLTALGRFAKSRRSTLDGAIG